MKIYAIAGEKAYTIDETDSCIPTAGEIEMQGPRPTPEHTAQSDGTWALSTATLEGAKAAKLEEISAAYAEYDSAGTAVTSFGWPVQVGQDHCAKLDGAIRFAEMAGHTEIYITDADNVTHYNMTLANAKQVLMEQMGAALAAHARKQALRAAVEAAGTIAEVEAITWA